MTERRKHELCAEFLHACLSFGWRKSDLDFLQKLWWDNEAWQFHKGAER